MVMIQGRRQKSNNISIYIWIFAILWVLLWAWYIFANNKNTENTDMDTTIDTWSTATWDIDTTTSSGIIQFIPDAKLMIDKSANLSIDVSVLSSSIVFTDGSSVATLIYFNCQANDPTRDCNALLNGADTIDTFKTIGGMIFVKQADGSRLWSSDNTIWYKIKTDSDQLFYDLSSMLTSINNSYIEDNISDIYENYCYDTSSRMTTIVSQKTRNVSNIWMTIVDGLDIDGKEVTCSISTTIEDNRLVVKVTDYSKWSSDNQSSSGTVTTWTNDDTIIIPEKDKSDTIPVATKVGTVPNLSASGIVFNSTRWWYSVTFPSKNVLYQGTNINTGLWLSDTNCYVNIWVKAYTDRDNSSIWNGVNIYECASKLSPDTIKSKLPAWTNVQTSPDGSKVFIIQSNDTTWNEFAQSVEIWTIETTPATWSIATVE